MKLTEEQLEQIGSYIESNFDRISAKSNVIQLRPYDIQLIERMTRIEEELKAQRELMQFGFNQMDKRFEAVDKRFEDVNKKFTVMMWAMGAGITIITTVITLLTIFTR
ncbi:MAG TPA: hypothetical protein PLM72_07755 [Spirochaetota bacterium]|nr:hypothetical protein [Spirochaetota bacterium]HQO22957.1 hypothetical protein [Spirochaetota bacterium]